MIPFQPEFLEMVVIMALTDDELRAAILLAGKEKKQDLLQALIKEAIRRVT